MYHYVNYKLLTPGPLTTSSAVKEAMLTDHCTWDDDYKKITQEIRKELLKLAGVSEDQYTAVLLQGSGTYGVESVLTSAVSKSGRLLVLANGAYGDRMEQIADHAGISVQVLRYPPDEIPSTEDVERAIADNPRITHVSMVHSETTSGILNDIDSVGKAVKKNGRVFIVDAMSSFAGTNIDFNSAGIDFLISSANKCIQGVPGFTFVICRRNELEKCRGNAVSLSLDLYDQWKTMEKDGKWRFTSPTHVVLAFDEALKELKKEGGIPVRSARYMENQKMLSGGMKKLGFRTYVPERYQGPIITTFICPDDRRFDFSDFYNYIKVRGYAIYPGKVTGLNTFRIGDIGEIYPDDIRRVTDIIRNYIEENHITV